MSTKSPGLPPRVYVPAVLIVAIVFLGILWYLLRIGFGATGAVLGPSAQATGARNVAVPQSNAVEGGPPSAVAAQLQSLEAEVAAHPNNDVALTQLGDLYLTAGKDAQALDYYKRALRANPHNTAAQAGFQQAQSGLGSGK